MGNDLVNELKSRKYLLLLIIALVIIGSDQWTKAIILEKFKWGESISIWEGFFNLTYVRNQGAAFGILQGADPAFRVPFFLAVPLIALVIIGFIFKKLPANAVFVPTGLSLVIGGAIGNLIDRVRFGYVVDFLDFHWQYKAHFPAFNIADAAICVGVGMLMLDMLRNEQSAKKGGKKDASASL